MAKAAWKKSDVKRPPAKAEPIARRQPTKAIRVTTERTGRKGRGRRSAEAKDYDALIGGRIKMRRVMLGMSQERLGEAIGLTFQQVQKYERGSNRVAGSTFYALSVALDVPVSFFFDDINDMPKMADDGREMPNRWLLEFAALVPEFTAEQRGHFLGLARSIAGR